MANLPSTISALTILPKNKEQAAAAEEVEKPPLGLEILITGSGAEAIYTLTLLNCAHHPLPAQTAFIASIYTTLHPLESLLLSSHIKNFSMLRPSAASSDERKATETFMGEVKKVMRKVVAFKAMMRGLEMEGMEERTEGLIRGWGR
ncbi:MAG: hypothetical protein L6R37_006859 [Teloschistes peruensis]|nr:MAG: hypothetical protein L6R37_006859 [Teloschistes peruensis]